MLLFRIQVIPKKILLRMAINLPTKVSHLLTNLIRYSERLRVESVFLTAISKQDHSSL